MELYSTIEELLNDMETGNVNWREVPSSLRAIERHSQNEITRLLEKVEDLENELENERYDLKAEIDDLSRENASLESDINKACNNAIFVGLHQESSSVRGVFLFNDHLMASDILNDKIKAAIDLITVSGKIPEPSQIIDLIPECPLIFVPMSESEGHDQDSHQSDKICKRGGK